MVTAGTSQSAMFETIFTKVNRAGKITDGGVAGTKVSRAHPTAAEVAAAWSVWLTAGACPASQADGAVQQ